MRPHFIIMPLPSLDNYLGLGAGTEPFEAEAFVAELAVEALRHAILPGFPGLDQRSADPLRADPGQQRLRDELRSVVAAQEGRCATLADEPRQHLDHPSRAYPGSNIDS